LPLPLSPSGTSTKFGSSPADDYRCPSGVLIEITLPLTTKERAKANIELYATLGANDRVGF
jgi:hypothetical protein